MSIKLIVFDLAGTTIYEGGAVYTCLRDTLAANGLDLSARDIASVKGLEKREALRQLIVRSELHDDLLQGLDVIFEDFSERMLSFYQHDDSVKEMPGAHSVFKELQKKNVRVAVNTGFTRQIADVLIDRMGWEREGLIDLSVASDEVPFGRPHPHMINKIMSELQIIESRSVAKVGDTPADLLEGRNAGCGMVLGFATSDAAVDELGRHPRDFVISELSVIPRILDL